MISGMLLCAGLGTRLRPITNTIPKPAVPFLNVPLSYYPLTLLNDLGCDNIVVNLHHLSDAVKVLFAQHSNIVFSDENNELLGTGGGIRHAHKLLGESPNFWVLNGDAVLWPQESLTTMLERHEQSNALATLLVIKHPAVGTKFGGIWTDNCDRVLDIGKNKPHQAIGWHYTGLQILSKRIFHWLPQTGNADIFRHALLPAIAAGEPVLIHSAKLNWFEVGSLTDYLDATAQALELINAPFTATAWPYKIFSNHWCDFAKRQSLYWGNHCQINSKIPAATKTILGNNCEIGTNVQIEGFLVCGDNVIIESGCYLKNVVFFNNQQVPKNTFLQNQIVQ